MTTKNNYEDINHVVHISTEYGASCEHCNMRIGFDNFAESINHYIEKHGYRLLHVGTETSYVDDKGLKDNSVAIVGK